MSREMAPRTRAILKLLLEGVTSEYVRARFGLSGNQLADITARHRKLLRGQGSLPVAFQLKLTETPAHDQKRARPAVAPGVPPLPLRARRLFSKQTPWEEFERWRVDVGGRLLVPAGALITSTDRAWRCEVSP